MELSFDQQLFYFIFHYACLVKKFAFGYWLLAVSIVLPAANSQTSIAEIKKLYFHLHLNALKTNFGSPLFGLKDLENENGTIQRSTKRSHE